MRTHGRLWKSLCYGLASIDKQTHASYYSNCSNGINMWMAYLMTMRAVVAQSDLTNLWNVNSSWVEPRTVVSNAPKPEPIQNKFKTMWSIQGRTHAMLLKMLMQPPTQCCGNDQWHGVAWAINEPLAYERWLGSSRWEDNAGLQDNHNY